MYNLIRGLSPYPAAFTELNGKKLKLFTCSKLCETPLQACGSFVTDNKTFFHIACTDGYIVVHELQIEGKKRMKIDEFLRGNKIKPDQRAAIKAREACTN